MAKNSGSRANWKLSDYIRYFTESKSIFNSESFEKIRESAQILEGYDDELVSIDNVYARNKVIQKLIGETFEYVNAHKEPKTSSGKERREIADEFMKLCLAEKKQMEDRKFTQFYNGKTFYETTREITYTELKSMSSAIKNLEKEPMSEDRIITYTNAVNHYIQACEYYLEALPSEVADEYDKEMRDSIQKDLETFKPCVDSMRDLRTIRTMISKGKSWKDLLELRTKETKIVGKLEKTSGVMSERIKVEVQGKTGFFTKENKPHAKEIAQQMIIEDFLGKYGMEDNGASRDVILKNLDWFKQFSVERKVEWMIQPKEAILTNMFKNWEQMSDPHQKASFQNLLKEVVVKDDATLLRNGMKISVDSNFTQAISLYFDQIKEAIQDELNDPEWKQKKFLEAVEKKIGNKDLAVKMVEHGKVLMDVIEKTTLLPALSKDQEMCIVFDNLIYKELIHTDSATETGKKTIEARKELLKRDDLKLDFASVHAIEYGAYANKEEGKMDERDQVELTGRNVATSRIAELLGIGNIVAHSEKMNVTINGKETTGCFMEFAEGLDMEKAETLSIDQLAEFDKIDLTKVSASLVRDGATLHLLDVICNQKDRHYKNFFMKFEIQNGEMVLNGLQGIDNDRAFGREFNETRNGVSGSFENVTMIDKSVAERIKQIDRAALQYAVGDILSDAEIDNLETCIKAVRDKINEKGFAILSGEEWNLDFDRFKDKDPKTLTKEETAYKAAVDRVKWQIDSPGDLSAIHENPFGLALHNVRELKKLHTQKVNELQETANKREKKQAEADIRKYKRLTSESFEDKITPVKKSEEELRAKRASLFDKLVTEKSNYQKTQTAPSVTTPKTPAANEAKAETWKKETKVLISTEELSKQEKAADRGIKFGAAREKAACKKELESSFIEITADDIAKANRNVKKPIIGGHRKK